MTRISAVPAGTRWIRYLPSGPDVVKRLVPTTITRASCSGVLAPAAVIVPVRLPCAAALAAIVINANGIALMPRLVSLMDLIVKASLKRWQVGENCIFALRRAG